MGCSLVVREDYNHAVAKISYPTETSVSRPLLIEAKHLAALDVVFEEFLQSQEAQAANRPAEDESGRRKSERRRQPVRSVDVYLSGGRTIKSDCFSDVIKQPHVSSEVALGFRAYLRTDSAEATVSVVERWTTELKISVENDDGAAARELFGSLENWASEVAAPRWQQLWARAQGLMHFLLFMWVFMGLMIAAMAALGVRDKNENYTKEAHALLQKGIDDSNQRRAIELTLALVSEYNPSVWKPGPAYWGVVLAGALALGALSVCPGVVIGIWTGKRRLEYWRVWLKVVWVTVPGLVFTSILWPRILGSLKLQ